MKLGFIFKTADLARNMMALPSLVLDFALDTNEGPLNILTDDPGLAYPAPFAPSSHAPLVPPANLVDVSARLPTTFPTHAANFIFCSLSECVEHMLGG